MEKINIKTLNESLFYEKLDNNLEVYMIPLKYKKNYFAFLGTKFGGINLSFKVNEKEYNVPSGVAHFLEHKLFEQDENPFTFYGKTGTDVNAATSYNYTGYYFSGNNSFIPNLTYLLNWITNFSITDSQVEKEKGIILEEAKMCLDNPNRVLYEKIKENTLVNSYYKNKIIGSLEEIKNITREDLYLCYHTFYNPSNMFLLITGDFNPEEAIKTIRENLSNFKDNNNKLELIIPKEKDEVVKEKEIIYLPVESSKVAISYKINKDKFKDLNLNKYYLDYYLQMILSLTFGTTSDFREYLYNKELFLSLDYNITDIGSHYLIEFYLDTIKEDEVISKITNFINNIKNIEIKEEDFIRIIKTWIASEVRMIDNVNSTLFNMLDDVLEYNEYKYDSINDKKKLKFKTMLEVLEKIDFSNRSILIIKKDR